MRTLIVSLFAFFLFAISGSAQSDLGVHFMRGVWQANYTNPALLPDHKVIVSVPGLKNQFSLENFSYNDLIGTNDDGQTVLQIDRVLELLDDDNVVREELDVPTFAVAVRIGEGILVQAGHRLRVDALVNYPRELPSLLWKGNAQFIGEEVEIGPDLAAQSYQEFFVGAALPIGEFLTLGARFKYLRGTSSLETSRTDLRLLTSDDIYQSILMADYQVNSTGILEYEGFSDNQFNVPDNPFAGVTGNNGVALDLGAVTTMGPVTITASVLDLGRINWTEEVENQTLSGTFEYKGLDILDQTLTDSIDIGSITDTLEALYDIQTSNADYRTNLPTRFFLSASYQMTQDLQLGGLLYGELYRGQFFPAVAASLNWDATNFFSLGGVYSARRESILNLGLHTAIRLGPVQIVAATDNILTAFQPGDSQTAHLRLGVNLGFGYINPDNRSNWNREESFFR